MFIRKKIPSILGLAILIAGLGAGVFLIGQEQMFRLGASADFEPKDVRISNVSDTSFTISWTTNRDALGQVNWGTTTSLGQSNREENTALKKVHYVTLRNLSPSTNYFFVINSGGQNYDNSGVPWALRTGPSISTPVTTALASGVVLDPDGGPSSGAIVYINSGKIAQLSAITSQNGSWTIPLSIARTKTLNEYVALTEDDTLELFVQGDGAVATVQTVAKGLNPVPNVQLGKSYDFRTDKTSGGAYLPEAKLGLPDYEPNDNSTGGLDTSVNETVGNGALKPVTLDTIDESGEIIYTTNPEFFGQGPANTSITITVESDPISDEVRVGSNGTWRWSPPANLPEGEHTITIKWRDAQGFLRSLTRTFVVQASEGEPSFVSTPSGASPSPSATPRVTTTPTVTPTASPTARPTVTPTISPSPTPTVSPTATPTRAGLPATTSGIPEAGSTAPTIFLGVIGMMLFISGIVISKRSA